MAQRSISARSRASSRTRRCRAHRPPICRAPPTAASSRRHDLVTLRRRSMPRRSRRRSSPPVTGAVELASSAPARSLDARAVLHRHLSPADQRRLRSSPRSASPASAGGAGTARSWRRDTRRSPRRVAEAIPRTAPRRRSPACPAWPMPGYAEVRLACRGRRDGAPSSVRLSSGPTWCTARPSSRSAAWGSVRRPAAGVPVVSSYHTDFGRYAEAYGMPWLRRAVTGYLTRFHRRSRRVYTPSAVAKAELAALGVDRGRGLGPGSRHERSSTRRRRSQELRERARHGKPVHLRLRRAAGAGEAGGRGARGVPPGHGAWCPRGVIHLVLAGTGPCEAELRAAAPPERHLPRAFSTDETRCPISTPTATRSSSPR